MNYITKNIVMTVLKTVVPTMTVKTVASRNSKANDMLFKFFYLYGIDDTLKSKDAILNFRNGLKQFYPRLHFNIVQNRHGLTIWVSDNLKFDDMLPN